MKEYALGTKGDAETQVDGWHAPWAAVLCRYTPLL